LARVPFARLMPSSHLRLRRASPGRACDLPNEEESSSPDCIHRQARVENALRPVAITGQFLQPVMRNEFCNRARPASCLRGFLVGVDAQRLCCFEGRCFIREGIDRSDDCLAVLALAVGSSFVPAKNPNIGPLDAAFRVARFLVDTVFACL
jgi:hypothetical protein